MRGWIALLLLVVAAPARADEPARVRVETEGECPTAEALESALASLEIGTDGSGDDAWVVRAVHPARGATRFELRAPGNVTPVETRAIASPDCDALAQTFALIVHTHFMELGLVVAPPEPVPEPSDPVPEPSISSQVPEPPTEVPEPVPTRWEVGLGVLGGLSVEPLLPSLLAQIDTSYLPEAHGPFVLRVLFAAAFPTTQTGALAVTRWALRPGLEAGVRFGDAAFFFQALGGVVVDLSAITAPGIPLFWRTSPGLSLSAGIGIHLERIVWVRLEVSEQVWLTYDRYFADPDLVAQSPRSSTVLALSTIFALDH